MTAGGDPVSAGWVAASAHQPELALMAAVLTDALRLIQEATTSPSRRRRPIFIETTEWVLSDDVSWPFAFRNLCAALSVNPERLRTQVASQLGMSVPIAADRRAVGYRNSRPSGALQHTTSSPQQRAAK